MKTLNEILNSAYNTATVHKTTSYGTNMTNAQFETDKGHKYRVSLQNDLHDENTTPKHVSNLSFEALGQTAIKDGQYKGMGVLGNEGRSVPKLLGTVIKTAHEHIKKFPHVTHVEFHSSGDEPSRTKLYHHMAKNIDPNYTHEPKFGGTQFNMRLAKKAGVAVQKKIKTDKPSIWSTKEKIGTHPQGINSNG